MSAFLDWAFGDDPEEQHEECRQVAELAGDLISQASRALADIPCMAASYGQLVPTRFLLIAEHCDLEGERWLTVVASAGMEPWEGKGMLSYAEDKVDIGAWLKVEQS